MCVVRQQEEKETKKFQAGSEIILVIHNVIDSTPLEDLYFKLKNSLCLKMSKHFPMILY